MAALTSRERLLRAFRCEPTDRMPYRLWGVDPLFPSANPTWAPLYEMARQYDIDVIRDWFPAPEEQVPSTVEGHWERRDSAKPDLWEDEYTLLTPDGPLTQISYTPRDGSPGYVHKHFLESVQDARRWLSIPSAPAPTKTDSYWELERRGEDTGLLLVGIGEAMYTIQAMMGSEVFGFWLMDERELLHELVDRAYEAILRQVKVYLAHGIGDAYGYVGPELCIPPLAGPAEFAEFVTAYDKPLIDLIHDAGKLVWVHCHGDMHPVLEDFVEMGVDCLNPIEPPPMGRLTLAEAKARCAGRMCLEGGVQNGDFDLVGPARMVEITEAAIAQGKPGGCYILGTTSTPTTWVNLSERHIANHRAFVETAARLSGYA